MKTMKQGLLRFPFAHDRWRKPPYSEMILQHGDEGRLAIQVYEAAVSLIATQHCVGCYDDVFLLCLSEDLKIEQGRLVALLQLAFQYQLFNMELLEKQRCLTSQAIQEEYFNVRKHFRFTGTQIETAHVLMPFNDRRMMYIGLVVEEIDVDGTRQQCYNEQMSCLYTKGKYEELFVGQAEIDMQMILQRKAIGLFNR